MSYDAWHPAPLPCDKPSVRTFKDWVYELSDAEYLDTLNSLYDSDEIEQNKEMYLDIKSNIASGIDEEFEFFQEIKSLLEERYRTDFYDEITYR